MKLSRLYSNKADLFAAIDFSPGLNVVLAEIRLPENRNKDTHNLGKTTLGRLLDFAFLATRDPDLFLFKHEELFSSFIFFLEIDLLNDGYLTIRRSVSQPSKISFKKHPTSHQNLSSLPDAQWDHLSMPFERAQEMLDSLLDWRALNPFHYRKALGYLLRSQDDYQDVFQLRRFAGPHAEWKPFVAHMLGFNSSLIGEQYQKELELEQEAAKALAISQELHGSIKDISKTEGILLLKHRDAEKWQKQLDAFDFRSQDKQHTKHVVEQIDEEIADLNGKRYTLNRNRKKILSSLQEDQILFSPGDAQALFRDSGVVFAGQIKRDFEQLIAFNRAISEERRGYLDEELSEVDDQLRAINSRLNVLGKLRSENLAYLSDTDVFTKYKKISDELVTLRTDIASLERQRQSLQRLQESRTRTRELKQELRRLQVAIEEDLEGQSANPESLFSRIRLFFAELVETVIDRKALLSASPNQQGHVEFKAEILDESGNATSADLGHTYRKLLCIGFDMAVLRGHSDQRFPRFLYHDGVFESLDDRKKENLVAVIREYVELGLQPIITVIDSDLPLRGGQAAVFDESEIVLVLHDQDEGGRLFRMKSW